MPHCRGSEVHIMLKDLVLKNRSYRRFYQDKKLSFETLTELIDCARVTPSTVNSQALKFKLLPTIRRMHRSLNALTGRGC